MIEEGEVAYLIQHESDQDARLECLDTKYAAMKALGLVSHHLFTRGSGLPSQASVFSSATSELGDTDVGSNIRIVLIYVLGS